MAQANPLSFAKAMLAGHSVWNESSTTILLPLASVEPSNYAFLGLNFDICLGASFCSFPPRFHLVLRGLVLHICNDYILKS